MDVEAYVVLTKGQLARVDPDDLDELGKYCWHAHVSTNGRYYARAGSKDGKVYMHRLLTGFPPEVDHANDDSLDNRRFNLRTCSRSQNGANKGKQRHNTSGFKGVHLHKKKWQAKIAVNGVTFCLGVHASPQLAALAYDRKAREMFGEFAKTNF